MAQKTSYSQSSTYISCPKYWDNQYNEGYESPVEGASLAFGSAIDAAVTEMLEGKQDWIKTFYDRWNRSFNFGTAKQIFDNDDIMYAHKDYDKDILEPKDFTQLEQWAKQLNLLDQNYNASADEMNALFKKVSEIKKNPYKTMSPDQLKYFNRACWLSLKRKGRLLLEAFNTQFYPKITKVLSTQQRATIKDEATGDSITGFVDFVVELEGYDKPIIFDLKTAGMAYSQENMDLTQQLVLYSAMKGKEFNTDLVGYVVLIKNIAKNIDYSCSVCGHQRKGMHRDCNNNVLDNATQKMIRCKGPWKENVTPVPTVQVLVEKKTQEQIDSLLADYGNIILAMKNRIVYKNTSKCNDWYGQKCIYYNVCHKNDPTGLVKRK